MGVPSGPAAEANRYRFSTKPQERAAGLSYYGYRYYAPSHGRWLSRDPLEEEGGVNLYAMTGNNPVESTDMIGLLTVHYWRARPSPFGWGHLSMTLDDGTYHSSWPTDELKHPFGGGDIRIPDYAKDMEGEGFSPENIRIDGLDEKAIKDWWNKRGRKGSFSGLGNNCSKTVADGLEKGGLKNLDRAFIERPGETSNNIKKALNPPAPRPRMPYIIPLGY